MATFTDRLKVIVDWDGKSAETGLGRFRAAVKSADTTTGKFKAGASAAMASVQANAGALAVAGGAALVAFGVKAVNAYTTSAKAAIDLGNATGFSTEQASRWIAVGDDFEVSGDAIASSVGRIAKDLDSTKWAEYGIATRDASGNARSANDIFLDVLDVLGKTSNETERARIAAQLLGKGWQGISPMIGKTRTEYEDMLEAVDEGQVITEGEAKKAERWRLAQDKLNEAFNEATMAVGELVASFAPLLENLADLVSWANRAGLIQDAMTPAAVAMQDYGEAAAFAAKHTEEVAQATDDAAGRIGFYEQEVDRTKKTTIDLDRESGSLESAISAIEKAADDAADAILDFADAQFQLLDAQDRADDSLADYNATLTDSESTLEDVDDAARNSAGAFIQLAKDQATAAGASEDTAAGQQIMIDELQKVADTLDPGSPLRLYLEGYIADLRRVPTNITTTFSTVYDSVTRGVDGGLDRRAAGGPVSSGTPYLVGEEGPELFVPGASGNIIPTDKLASAGSSGVGGVTNIYVDATGMNPDELVRVLKEHMRRNGGSL